MFKNSFFVLTLCCSAHLVKAQQIGIHSHNDYQQNVPFWTAYKNGLNSIEIDVFLKYNTLYVTHSESEIIAERTIENLYLNPIKNEILYSWNPDKKLQLLIDIKSETQVTLNKLVQTLNQYPELIDQRKISIVISGNRPDPKEYSNYPDYILFDYQSLDPLKNEEIWNKIALISLSFKKFSNWNGKGKMTEKYYRKVDSVVRIAHQYGKPFRFWATPDTKTAWELFRKLGIDYINTDQPAQASAYFNKAPQ
ncbi:MAG: phosphatidylinositol-specific phospholipase C/glycerophosphodiester phosphodiesterase family protein [Flavobacteriaceae bacterium]